MSEKYVIPERPEYKEEIRKLDDEDWASASQTFNPLFERIVENTHAVKKEADAVKRQVAELEETVELAGRNIKTLIGSETSDSATTRTASIEGITSMDEITGACVHIAAKISSGPDAFGAATLNINNLGAFPLSVEGAEQGPESGASEHYPIAIKSGTVYTVFWDGARYTLVNPSLTYATTNRYGYTKLYDGFDSDSDAVAATANAAATAYKRADYALERAEKAYILGESAGTDVISAYGQANSAFGRANDAYSKANSAYDLAAEGGSASAVQANLSSHTENIGNPHNVTKAQLQLGNVNNTSDANKPVSTATQSAIDDVANTAGVAQNTAATAQTTAVAAQNTAGTAQAAAIAAQNAATAAQSDLNTHKSNTALHVTQVKQTSWDGAVQAAASAKEAAELAQSTANNVRTTARQAQETADGKASAETFNGTLTTSWSGSGPFTQSINISGITTAMNPIVGPVLSTAASTAKNQLAAWSCVGKIVTNAGSITATCYDEKPTTPIQIQLIAITPGDSGR